MLSDTNGDAVYDGTGEKEVQAMRDQTEKLVSDGLENKLLSVLQDLLSSTYPENMVCTFLTMNGYPFLEIYLSN